MHDEGLLGPSGGAAAYRRDAYSAAGGLDEGTFAYMEDVDLALRLRDLGWAAAGAPGATGIHLGSATFGHRSRAQVEIAGASRAYMLRKYGVLRRGLTTGSLGARRRGRRDRDRHDLPVATSRRRAVVSTAGRRLPADTLESRKARSTPSSGSAKAFAARLATVR